MLIAMVEPMAILIAMVRSMAILIAMAVAMLIAMGHGNADCHGTYGSAAGPLIIR